MARFAGKFVLFWALFICLIGLANQSATGAVIIFVTPQMLDITGTNYNINILALSYSDSQGESPMLSSVLLSITNGGENVPFVNFGVPGPFTNNGVVYFPNGFYGFPAHIAPDVLDETYTLTWTNYSADVTADFNPSFLVQPRGQSVFVGSNVVLTAQAVHTTGYQWQRGGTNLVEDGHFIGVTNAALTISNAQVEDSGDYTVIANHPDNPTTSSDAVLGVFKPIQFGLTPLLSAGSYQLQVGNQDHSPVDDNEVSHFTVYTTTDLSLGMSDWDVVYVTGVLTNGIYQLSFPDDGSPGRFWVVGQQP